MHVNTVKKWPVYKFAPVLEAIIDIQFDASKAYKTEWMNTLKHRIAAEYPTVTPIVEGNFTLQLPTSQQPQGIVSSLQEQAGVRFQSADNKRVLQVRKDRFSYSVMAPYTTWDDFCGSAEKAWNRVETILKPGNINQLGVRYINRIDIPARGDIRLEDYFTLYPHLPDSGSEAMEDFLVRFVLPVSKEYKAFVTQASAVPPKENMSAIVMDIEVVKAQKTGRRKENIWKHLGEMRAIKNHLFESFITKNSRELFNYVNTKS